MPLDPTIGEIALFAFNRQMQGWIPCDGRLLPVAQNQALYSLIGNSYGGIAGQTFAVPNLNGRTPVGATLSGALPPGMSPYALGNAVGQTTVSLSIGQMPTHSHNFLGTTHDPNAPSIVDAVYANVVAVAPDFPVAPNLYGAPTALTNFDPGTVLPTGQGVAHENMQPTMTLYYMIAAQGLYPTRNS